jgi:hypothetical protein
VRLAAQAASEPKLLPPRGWRNASRVVKIGNYRKAATHAATKDSDLDRLRCSSCADSGSTSAKILAR